MKGEGQVTVTHDKDIDQLVNSMPVTAAPQPKKATEEQPAKADKPEKPAVADKTDKPEQTEQTDLVDNRRKVMAGGYKVNGYRVQAFAGGNQRKDRVKAEQIGNTIKASYPTEPIYVHFYSPRWICRVGNYRTYEEAHQMLLNIRKLGISGASIVKGKITVPY